MTPQPGFSPHVQRLGQGPVEVLALHCTLAFSGAWSAMSREVGADLTLIAPDMPSHGQSPDWDGKSSFVDTAYSGALSCLDRPRHVIGHSFGGATALRLAVDYPELVLSLTLIEPVYFGVVKLDAPEVLNQQLDVERPVIELLDAGRHEEAARRFNRIWGEGTRWAQLPPSVHKAMARGITAVKQAAPLVVEDSIGLIPKLGQATMPVLLMRGETSFDVVRVANAGLAKRLPDAREAVVTGAGHMAPITHASDVTGIWRTFLDPLLDG